MMIWFLIGEEDQRILMIGPACVMRMLVRLVCAFIVVITRQKSDIEPSQNTFAF